MTRTIPTTRLILLAFLAGVLLASCGSVVEPRALCRGAELTNAADSTGTRALGSAYRVEYCDNATYADTLR